MHAGRIRVIGRWLLGRASRGVRDGRLDRKTYDLSFVGAHGAFASITAALGKFNKASEGKLRVDARFDLSAGGLRIFHCKDWGGGERGWHFAHVGSETDVEDVLGDLERSRQ